MHSKNRHQGRYDFPELIKALPELSSFVRPNPYGDLSIDFANPKAVKTLNHAILKSIYQINFWDIPQNALCPPIPGRADYIHFMAELLGYPSGPHIKALDIGTGASLIYPLIGHSEYKWNFVATDINEDSLKNSSCIIQENQFQDISLRHQTNSDFIFKGIIKDGEFFHLSLCNPPFHASLAEATEGSQRKWKNLKNDKSKNPVLNFGGQGAELWCKGGESQFIKNMIEESSSIKKSVLWFSTLVSKSEHLDNINRLLLKTGVSDKKTFEMIHGQKKTRIVAWTYFSEKEINEKLRS